MPPSAALIVGVNDYAAYDQSAGLEPGTSDLRGSVNDARVWLATALALGLQKIRVLTSPQITAADLDFPADGVEFGPATSAAILDGVAWLGGLVDGEEPGQALFTWSGHGALRADGPALCPADTVAPVLQNALSTRVIAAALERHAPRTNVTLMLDACHAAPPPQGVSGLLVPGRRALCGVGSSTSNFRFRSRDLVLAACATQATAQEYHFQGRWQGAFTWATTTLIGRWGVGGDGGIRWAELDYARLAREANTLLASARFPQRTVYEGPAALAGLPVLHPKTLADVPTSDTPIAGGGIELDPGSSSGVVYEIRNLSGSTILGTVAVTGESPWSGWTANREYWFWNGAAFPTSGFRIAVVGSSAPNLTPSDAWRYTNESFASNTSNWDVSAGNGNWFQMQQGNGSSWVGRGWMKNKSTENHWYELGNNNGNAAPYLTLTSSAPILRFVYDADGPNNQEINNASMINATLLGSPS